MTNRLQLRRGASDAQAVPNTRAGEPLFNSTTGQLYVSNGTEVFDVVLEGLRRVRNIYTGSIGYPIQSYVTFNGNTYRSGAAIAAGDPDPENNTNWVRFGFTENEIRAFANEQQLQDTTAVHLDISHGTFFNAGADGFILTDEIATGATTPVDAAILYNEVTDVVTLTINTEDNFDTQAEVNSFFGDLDAGTSSLLSLTSSPDERTAGENDGNLVSIFDANLNTDGTPFVVLRAHPYPSTRRLLRTLGVSLTDGANQGQRAITSMNVSDNLADAHLTQFTPLVSGQLLRYNQASSEASGLPVIETIRRVSQLPTNPAIGEPIVLSAPRGYDLNVRPAYPLALHRTGSLYNMQRAYNIDDVAGFPDYSFNDTTAPFEDEYVTYPGAIDRNISQTFNETITETWIPFVRATRTLPDGTVVPTDPFLNSAVAIPGDDFANRDELAQDFQPGDLVRFWHGDGDDFTDLRVLDISPVRSGFNSADQIGGAIPSGGLVHYVRFSGFLDLFDIGLDNSRLSSTIPFGAGSAADISFRITGARNTAVLVFRNSVNRDSVFRALTTNVPGAGTTSSGQEFNVPANGVGSVLISDGHGRPMFAFAPDDGGFGTGAGYMTASTSGLNEIHFTSPTLVSQPVIHFINFDPRGNYRTSHTDGGDASHTITSALTNGSGGFEYNAGSANRFLNPGNPAIIQASYRPASGAAGENFNRNGGNDAAAFEYFFPAAGRTQVGTTDRFDATNNGAIRYIHANNMDRGSRTALRTTTETNLLAVRSETEERGNIPQNRAELGLRVWNGFSWR